MTALGRDIQGSFAARAYRPSNPAGPIVALVVALVLVGIYVTLPAIFGVMVNSSWGGDGDLHQMMKAMLVGLLPAALTTVAAAWFLAYLKGGRPADVLALRRPSLGWLGWIAVVGGFLASFYAAIAVIVTVFGIDLAQYTPGPDGQSPETGSAGLVKETMFDIANEPKLFALILLSVGVGAPLAEEVVFRGQLFAALSRTRIGAVGATLSTSAVWALLHATEPWLSIGLIFMMGLAFGFLLVRFGSLWVTIACHAAWNAIYSVVIFGSIQS
ncbi:MAG: CPBP family intramembrane glutamic endopeptidase [Hyphomicrobiales bacterium]